MKKSEAIFKENLSKLTIRPAKMSPAVSNIIDIFSKGPATNEQIFAVSNKKSAVQVIKDMLKIGAIKIKSVSSKGQKTYEAVNLDLVFNVYEEINKMKLLEEIELFCKFKNSLEEVKAVELDLSITTLKKNGKYFYFYKNVNSRLYIELFEQSRKEHNKTGNQEICMIQGCCNKATHYHKRTSGGNCPQRYCDYHFESFAQYRSEKGLRHRKKMKAYAVQNAQDYFDANFKEMKNLNFKNKNKILKMIKDYYKNDVLCEPRFRILLHDILKLVGGEPFSEYPVYFKKNMNPLKDKLTWDISVDILDRKLKLAIETKASYRETNYQELLEEQLQSYRKAFPKFKSIGVCPDGSNGWAAGREIIGLLEFLKLLSKIKGVK